MSKNNSNYGHYDHLENIEIDGADDKTPGFFRRGWYRLKESLTNDVVPFLKKYWFETTLAVLLLAFAIALIVMIQLYPVLILGIAFITIGNAMPFAFLGSMSVAAATASITAIVLGVGALKIAVLSAIKNGISIFASWCWDRFKQESDLGGPSPLDDLSESEQGSESVSESEPESKPESKPEFESANNNSQMILSPVTDQAALDDESFQESDFSGRRNGLSFFSHSSVHSSDDDEEPFLNRNNSLPVLSVDDNDKPDLNANALKSSSPTKSFCSIM